MKIKNRADYLSNDNMTVNVKDFDSGLLEINKLSFNGVLVLIVTTSNTSQQKLSIILIMIKIIFICFLMTQMGTLKKTMELNIQFLKNYKKLWKESKRQIKVINGDEPIKYKKNFMKIKFESDDNLLLGKTFSIPDIIITAASVLEKDGKFYPQIFLDECAYKL